MRYAGEEGVGTHGGDVVTGCDVWGVGTDTRVGMCGVRGGMWG